jgi:hypothetical protein
MHDGSCSCDCCRDYSVPEQERALKILLRALERVREPGSGLSADERRDLDSSEVVRLDAGFRHPIPAVVFQRRGRLRALKAGFTYGYLLNAETAAIGDSVLSRMREHLSE